MAAGGADAAAAGMRRLAIVRRRVGLCIAVPQILGAQDVMTGRMPAMKLVRALTGLRLRLRRMGQGLHGRRGPGTGEQALGGMALQGQGQGQHPCQCDPPESAHAWSVRVGVPAAGRSG